MFTTVTEKFLPAKVNGTVMSWCPVADLIAFAPEDGIWLYRLNGQRVWSIKCPSKPTNLTWKHDGKLLAVVYENKSYQILSASNGKPVVDGGSSSTFLLTWFQHLAKSSSSSSTEEYFNLDIQKSMPKLPSLPSNFQAFASVSLDETPSEVEIMVMGSENGALEFSIDGVFNIGKRAMEGGEDCSIIKLDANNDLSGIMSLIENNHQKQLIIWKVDFVRKLGLKYLKEVSLTPARILALVAYIKEAVNIISTETKELFDQTSRAMDLMTMEGIQNLEMNSASIQGDLFDTLITGVVKPSVRQFLKHNLGERGLKKWHKSCTTGYETTIKVLFENLIPALERLILLLSRLQGLAEWRDRGAALGLKSKDIQISTEPVIEMMKLATSCLRDTQNEHDLFKAFSSWLEVVYEELPNASMTSRMNQDPSSVKTTDVGKFITQHLNSSCLKQYLGDNNGGCGGVGVATGSSMQGNKFRHLCNTIEIACQHSFTEIKHVLISQVTELLGVSLAPSNYKVSQFYDREYQKLYIVMVEPGTSVIKFVTFSKLADDEKGIVFEIACVDMKQEIIQFQFIDNFDMVLVLHNSGENIHSLVSLEYGSGLVFKYVDDIKHLQVEFAQLESQSPNIQHSRQLPSSKTPGWIAINGQESRKIGVMLLTDQQHYEFFSLDEHYESE